MVVDVMAVVTFYSDFIDGINVVCATHAFILEMYQAVATPIKEFIFAVLALIICYYCTLYLKFPFMLDLGTQSACYQESTTKS